jgi:hypothetical protein
MNALSMLFGAALVALGVLAAALADRIRGLRVTRRDAEPRERARREPSVPIQQAIPVVETVKQPRAPRVEPKVARDEGGDDVIAALVASGFKKPVATEAAWACSAAERTTVEVWTACALRRCARGGMS